MPCFTIIYKVIGHYAKLTRPKLNLLGREVKRFDTGSVVKLQIQTLIPTSQIKQETNLCAASGIA